MNVTLQTSKLFFQGMVFLNKPVSQVFMIGSTAVGAVFASLEFL